MYKIYLADEFERSFNKLDNSIQEQIDKEIEQLITNPYAGKPLGYSFFREKKIRNYRIYYLIYKEEVVVFLISISNKKDQQKSIDKIKALIPIYKEEIQRKFNL